MKFRGPKYYPEVEEKINVVSHAFGILLSIAALIMLVLRANFQGNAWHIVSFSIYGASLIVLYTASTLFHSSKNIRVRHRLNLVDHASIYVLIAGTYTPFALVTLKGPIGWVVFGVIWGLAVSGIILKFFFIGRYYLLSTIMYVLMGWIMIFAVKPLINNLAIEGILWLLAGGVAYTVGAVFFSLNKIKFNHAIFHMFVLMGSFCHFMSIYIYVLPRK
ncbi:MAG: hemolysin III family protein [Bacteroidales bacterium]|nr:hemolysin III family protein [Bacteroidales bacterium]